MGDDSKPSRRDVLKTASAAALSAGPLAAMGTTTNPKSAFLNIIREPDLVRVMGLEEAMTVLDRSSAGTWRKDKSEVVLSPSGNSMSLAFRGTGVTRIHLRWRGDMRTIRQYLGDHWERSYADLEWRGEAPNRVMPWYFMAYDGAATHGYGVKTQPRAMCFWTADAEGISLWADVRSGGVPVELGDRQLQVCTIVCREGHGGESSFAATRAFCQAMCSNPRLTDHAVYGTNDWNYAYGNSSAELIAGVSGLISELSPSAENRPYSVIDEGWAMGPFNNNFGHGPWEGNPRFGDMGKFAERLRSLGVRPGIWFRPLTPLPDAPKTGRSARNEGVLDPTFPETHEHVATHIRKFTGWGYEMIKHDFTSWDLFGRWGFQMDASPTKDGWKLHDSSRTNAEVLLDLYQTIRDAAGMARLIGCNTMSHLAAGTHELQRTGDDTSGVSWNRNRRMGVNTLAFRAPQHRVFFAMDPDIASITKQIPWELTEQWLRLVSSSGTSLFVAIDPSLVEPKHRTALKAALTTAAKLQPVGEPLDWMATQNPRRWKLQGKTVEFAWMGESGSFPFPD